MGPSPPGGPTGYAGREVFATPDSSYVLRDTQAIAWNPAITRVKSEDTILIDRERFEVVTRTGDWPDVDVDLGGLSVQRPDILTT